MSHAVFWLAPAATTRSELGATVDRMLQVPELARRVHLIRTAPTSRSGRGLKAIAAARAMGELDRLVRSERDAPVVHVHVDDRASLLRQGLLAARARASGCALVVTLHRRLNIADDSGLERALGILLSRAARVIALTPSVARSIRGIAPADRISVLPHGMRLPDRLPEQPRGRTPTVLLCGGDDAACGELLVRAVRGLPRGTQARWLLAGAGGLSRLAEELRAARKGPVEIVGWLRGNTADRAWARSNILALPACDMHLPIWALDAMAHGRPVLTSRNSGAADAVYPGGGWLTKSDDAGDWSAALAHALKARSEHERMGHVARSRAEALFDGDLVAERLMEIYEQVAAGDRKPWLLRLPHVARAVRAHLTVS